MFRAKTVLSTLAVVCITSVGTLGCATDTGSDADNDDEVVGESEAAITVVEALAIAYANSKLIPANTGKAAFAAASQAARAACPRGAGKTTNVRVKFGAGPSGPLTNVSVLDELPRAYRQCVVDTYTAKLGGLRNTDTRALGPTVTITY